MEDLRFISILSYHIVPYRIPSYPQAWSPPTPSSTFALSNRSQLAPPPQRQSWVASLRSSSARLLPAGRKNVKTKIKKKISLLCHTDHTDHTDQFFQMTVIAMTALFMFSYMVVLSVLKIKTIIKESLMPLADIADIAGIHSFRWQSSRWLLYSCRHE